MDVPDCIFSERISNQNIKIIVTLHVALEMLGEGGKMKFENLQKYVLTIPEPDFNEEYEDLSKFAKQAFIFIKSGNAKFLCYLLHYCVQWNVSVADILGAAESVLISDVSTL